MQVQDWLFRLEELKAMTSLFEDLIQTQARSTVIQQVGHLTEDQEAQVRATQETVGARMAALEELARQRTGQADMDGALRMVEEQLGRFQVFQDLRREHVQLRLQLDLELASGQMPREQRKKAEHMLEVLQSRMDEVVSQARKDFPATRLIAL